MFKLSFLIFEKTKQGQPAGTALVFEAAPPKQKAVLRKNLQKDPAHLYQPQCTFARIIHMEGIGIKKWSDFSTNGGRFMVFHHLEIYEYQNQTLNLIIFDYILPGANELYCSWPLEHSIGGVVFCGEAV